MRTTLTLDDDLAVILKRTAEASGRPFKQVVNDAIRAGLHGRAEGSEPVRYPQPSNRGGSRIDLTQALSIAAALDDEKTIALLRGETWPRESDDRS